MLRLIRVLALVAAAAFGLSASPAPAGAASNVGGGCVGHRFNYLETKYKIWYSAGCSGHDEPELDPVSSLPGSAQDLTWKVVLPTDGAGDPFGVSSVGPTFWFGGTVTDPKSFMGQAFVEMQFYPDSVVTSCSQNGGFEVHEVPNKYSICTPVWQLTETGQKGVFHEDAAFNGMVRDGSSNSPLVMSAGDTVTIHWFITAAKDGYHATVTDLTTGHSGTIVLNSTSLGPLMPAFSAQKIGNALAWGAVDDTPNAFVWEIGHTSPYYRPETKICFPGQPVCESYNASSWLANSPIDIESVTFANGSQPTQWATVSDLGGKTEVDQHCGAANYGGADCIYPWYSSNSSGSFHYGVNFPDSVQDYGRANQFAQQPLCGGPFGPDSTYCDTVIK